MVYGTTMPFAPARSTSPKTAVLLPLLAALTLGGCGEGAGRYPSLAQRPAERAFAQAAPPAAPVPVKGPTDADPETLKQIDSLHEDATRAAETFATRAEEADRLTGAARGAGVGSEAWAAATVATAALDSARSATALPLADLDALRVHTAVVAADSGKPRDAATYVAITRVDNEVAAILAREDARIAALHHAVDN
jgi:hypothetical protein